MLEVHIPSVGPEAEGTRQNPEKGHMVSWGSGWEGARGPTGFPRAEGNGDPALRSRAPERGGPGGRGTPCRGSLGRWGLLALPTAVPAPEGLHRAEPPSVRERGRVPGEPRSSQAALCFCGRTVGWGRRRERVWRRPCAGSHAHPAARRRPPGVPSGGAVPRAQTRRAEALQRVPRAPQADQETVQSTRLPLETSAQLEDPKVGAAAAGLGSLYPGHPILEPGCAQGTTGIPESSALAHRPQGQQLGLYHRPVVSFPIDPYICIPSPEPLPNMVVLGVLQGLYGFNASTAEAQPEAACHPAPVPPMP